MLKVLLVSVFFIAPGLSVASAAESQWYWASVPTDPMTGYFIEEISPNTIGYTETNTGSYGNMTVVPESFMDTMEAVSDSNKCSGKLDSAIAEVRKFDYDEVVTYEGPCKGFDDCLPYFRPDTIEKRELLLSSLEDSTKECLETEQKELQEAEEERKRKEAEEKHLQEIQMALESCDDNFFANEMTDNERMDTYDERMACKEKRAAEAESESEPTLTSELEPAYVPPVVEPVVVSELVEHEAPSKPMATVSAAEEPETEDGISEVVESEEVASSTSSPKETVEMTQRELDQLIEQRVNEALDQSEPEPTPEPEKPSLFKRVWNFFTGLFR